MPELEAYDFFGADPRSVEDPYAFLEQARERGPVYRDPASGAYVVLSYDLVVEVARDVQNFSSIVSERGPLTPFRPIEGKSVSESLAHYRSTRADADSALLTRDPPEHPRMRALCGKLFTPNRMLSHRARIAAIADELVEELLAARRCDWVADFAEPMAFLVICQLFGVPIEDQREFRQRMSERTEENRPGNPASADPAVREQSERAQSAQIDYFTRHLADRRKHPSARRERIGR